MKKIITISAAFAAALCLVSCNKETADSAINLPEGKVVSFTLDVPGEQENPEEDVKLSFGEQEGNKIHMTWNAGDAFALITRLADGEYSYNTDTKKVEPSSAVTECGSFTTTDDGVSTATFVGTIPDAAPDQNGMAIFPASAYTAGSGDVSWSSGNGLLMGFTASLPDEQDGTGVKYLVATAKLKEGNLGKFTFPFAMIKINVPANQGITKVVLSLPDTPAKPLCSDNVRLYYYFSQAGCSLSTTKDKGYSITVSKGGEEISGDVYFVTRNLDKGYKLSLTYHKGTQISKPQTASLPASLSGGALLDYGTVPVAVFPEQTAISWDRNNKACIFVPSYEGKAEGELFPYSCGSDPAISSSTYKVSLFPKKSDESYDIVDYKWYCTEHDYTFGGYTWTFGTTIDFSSGSNNSNGKYYYTGYQNRSLRMDTKAYLKLPVVSGKKLVSMSISIANSAARVWWKLANDNAATSCLAGASAVSMSKDSGVVTVNLTDTEVDTRYYLISQAALQPITMTLVYQ